MLGRAVQVIQQWLANRSYPVVAGISGGPDSMALLSALVANGVPVFVAHVDHMLRGDSSEDCAFVGQQAEKLGVPFYSTEIDIKRLANQRKISLESAGREARYNFLFRLATEVNAQAVVVGHTADDQVETVLMHLLRGSGSDGLGGMSEVSIPNEWSRSIPLIRPILGIFREEVLEYCQVQNIPYRLDLSNNDPVFFRNRIRHEVLPYLQSINPKIKFAIWRTAGLLGDEAKYLDQEMFTAWSDAVKLIRGGQLRIMRGVIATLPIVLQRRMWRNAIRSVNGPAEIGFDMVEMAISLTNSTKTTGRYDLGGGSVLYLAEDRAWLAPAHVKIKDPDWPLCNDCGENKLQTMGKTLLADPWSIQAEWLLPDIERGKKDAVSTSQNHAWFQGITPATEMILRCRKPGDRIVPFGLEGQSKKLAEIMINEKIPAPARDRWPLICVGETVLWIPGCVRSNHFLVKEGAGPILHLALNRDNQFD